METQVQEAPPAPTASPKRPEVDVDAIYDKIGRYFQSQPATRSLDYCIRLEDLGLNEKEAAYYAKVIRNFKLDELRQDRVWRKHFRSLDGLMEDARLAEEDGFAPEFVEPSIASEEPEIALENAAVEARFRQALLALPIELAVLVCAMPLVDGNVSALARELGQPQRRTARQFARIRKHFAGHGLSV